MVTGKLGKRSKEVEAAIMIWTIEVEERTIIDWCIANKVTNEGFLGIIFS